MIRRPKNTGICRQVEDLRGRGVTRDPFALINIPGAAAWFTGSAPHDSARIINAATPLKLIWIIDNEAVRTGSKVWEGIEPGWTFDAVIVAKFTSPVKIQQQGKEA